jgi:hypothetical protein
LDEKCIDDLIEARRLLTSAKNNEKKLDKFNIDTAYKDEVYKKRTALDEALASNSDVFRTYTEFSNQNNIRSLVESSLTSQVDRVNINRWISQRPLPDNYRPTY